MCMGGTPKPPAPKKPAPPPPPPEPLKKANEAMSDARGDTKRRAAAAAGMAATNKTKGLQSQAVTAGKTVLGG